ncbi:MAG: hypothetical protein ABSF12_24925 [Bryobacteraceae bacterium]
MRMALVGLFVLPLLARAQGGPPYYTTDPGTPGPNSWEINLGYMPFLYNNMSISHVPDVDINYGIGERIQLTYESAWLRVVNGIAKPKYGVEQDQLGFKWRFYDNEKAGFAVSLFPQASFNNPGHAVPRGITPPGASLLLPMEFTKKVGPIDVNWEVGYNGVHLGPSDWIAGLMVGHDVTKKLEVDAEFYGIQTFNHSNNQQTIDGGLRYKLRPPFILLLMAGRSATSAHNGQPYFVGYFGMQFLLPPKPFD